MVQLVAERVVGDTACDGAALQRLLGLQGLRAFVLLVRRMTFASPSSVIVQMLSSVT